MSNLPNIRAVARREFVMRTRTRAFRLGTIALLLGVAAISFAPVIVSVIEGASTDKVAVYNGSDAADPAATLRAILNPPGRDPDAEIVVVPVADLATALAAERGGAYKGVLAVTRDTAGDLTIRFYTDEGAMSQLPQLVLQAAGTLTAQDRLVRLGVAPAAQASLFAPADYRVESTNPEDAGAPKSIIEGGSEAVLGFGLTILIFVMILLYGNWVAMSVVEEKSSRVMEVILNAATPFQLLAGKVLGVGAAAAVQYMLILAVGGTALLLQDPVTSLILGQQASNVALPEGLTAAVLVLFVAYGVLGFLLYAVLYAAAGSLVSRQEDVSSVVQPLTMVAALGYVVAAYTAVGLIDVGGAVMTLLSLFPFTSPFVVVSRAMGGTIAPWEVVASLAVLSASIVAALWLAARVYAAGVLLYGQRPSARRVIELVRTGA